MSPKELDRIDRGILYLLQQNARNHTTTEIGEKVGVSSSTVANRITRLEERGVIKGYHPTVDYEKTGLGYHLLLSATVSLEEQETIVDEIMEIVGVVSVRELLTNTGNLSIELVARNREDVERSLANLNALGVEIEGTEIVKGERTRPYNHFGKQYVSGNCTG